MGENLGEFGGPQLPYHKSYENSAAGGKWPITFDYHMEKLESFCDVTSGL